MYVLMICHHAPDMDVLRDQLRPQHRAWVAAGGHGLARVLTGSALWDDTGAGIGNFGILEVADMALAREFAMGDPFYQGGLVVRLEFTRLADTFQAARIQPLTS